MFKKLKFKLLRKKTYDLRDKVLDVVSLFNKGGISIQDAKEMYENLDVELHNVEILSDGLCTKYPDMDFIVLRRLNKVDKALAELKNAIEKQETSKLEQ